MNTTGTENANRDLSTFSLGYHPALAATICAIAIPVNIVHIRILMSHRLRHLSISVLLAAIAICDIGTMASYMTFLLHFRLQTKTTAIYNHCHFLIDTYSKAWVSFMPYHASMTTWLHSASIWLCVVLCVFRYLTLLNADNPKVIWLQFKVGLRASAGIFVATLPITAAAFFMHQVAQVPAKYVLTNDGECVEHTNGTQQPIMVYTNNYSSLALDDDCLVLKIYWVLIGLLFKLLPCVILCVCSALLLNKLRTIFHDRPVHRQHQTPPDTTALVIGVASVFVLTELPQGLVTLISVVWTCKKTSFYDSIGDTLDFLSLINSATTLLLSMLLAPAYRRAARECFTLDTQSILNPMVVQLHTLSFSTRSHMRTSSPMFHAQQNGGPELEPEPDDDQQPDKPLMEAHEAQMTKREISNDSLASGPVVWL